MAEMSKVPKDAMPPAPARDEGILSPKGQEKRVLARLDEEHSTPATREYKLADVVIFVQPYKRESRAAIVAAVRDGKPDLTVFSPNGGSNIQMAVPHISEVVDIDRTGAWRWPDEADA